MAARPVPRCPLAPRRAGWRCCVANPHVGFDDVRRVAAPAMAHRLVLDYAARLEGWDGRRVVAALFDAIPEIERGLPQTLGAR